MQNNFPSSVVGVMLPYPIVVATELLIYVCKVLRKKLDAIFFAKLTGPGAFSDLRPKERPL